MSDTIVLRRDGIEATVKVGDVVPMTDGSERIVDHGVKIDRSLWLRRHRQSDAWLYLDDGIYAGGPEEGWPAIDIAKLAEQQAALAAAPPSAPTARRVAPLINEAAEYITHRPECAHGGRGDEYCDCGAVDLLARLEAMLTADDVDQEYSNEIMLRGKAAPPSVRSGLATGAMQESIDFGPLARALVKLIPDIADQIQHARDRLEPHQIAALREFEDFLKKDER